MALLCVGAGKDADAGAANASSKEVRALWVVRTSITSPAKVTNLVRRAVDTGFNTLLVQVRGRGDSYFLGGTEPRAEDLAAQSSNFDPLAAVLDAAGKNGLSVHAWVNVNYVWSGNKLPLDPSHLVNAKPEWLAMDSDGVRPKTSGRVEGAYTCPSDPEVRAHIRSVIRDLVARYRLDGIHLDYIRYPNEHYCYCPGCIERFKQYLGDAAKGIAVPDTPKRFATQWTDWRREQISALVRDIRDDLSKTGVALTAAVWVDVKRARDTKFQDWPRWCKEGWLDAVLPMNYAVDEATYRELAEEAMRQAGTTQVWMGIGAWRLEPEENVKRIRIARQLGAAGVSLFSYGGLTNEGTSEKKLTALREVFGTER
ncbi:MAG: family 10 glycosylhydrolase [Fimbriimonadia bacterium]|jgi:uncharacterized lipoprotein YddW (UPF0748 family)